MPPEFALLETMRLEHGVVVRLDRHLARMRGSAGHFGYAWDEPRVRAAVAAAATDHPQGLWRVRLTLDRAGTATTECSAHSATLAAPWRLAFAATPVDHRDPFLFNKTTHRTVYETARASTPGVDDVLLWNERGEVTESTIANIVVEIDGRRVTPPVRCGLLPGTYRAELLENGSIQEQVLTKADVSHATRLWLINSLRGWIDATLAFTETSSTPV